MAIIALISLIAARQRRPGVTAGRRAFRHPGTATIDAGWPVDSG